MTNHAKNYLNNSIGIIIKEKMLKYVQEVHSMICVDLRTFHTKKVYLNHGKFMFCNILLKGTKIKKSK